MILDLSQPGLDGLEVCRAVRRESNIPVLMLTARVEEADRLIGLELVGQKLSSSALSTGAPILVDGEHVGTVFVTPTGFSSSTPAGLFLSSVNRSIILSVIVASGAALLLGWALFAQITAPLRRLKTAASAISQHDLSQRVVVNSHDELGDLSQAFNQMAQSLEKAEGQRRRMMADIAHELRTPLSVIQANLEGMLDGVLPLDAGQVIALHEETLLLNRLVSDLRLLSLAEAGELALERQETDLGDLLHRVVERLGGQARQKGIVLEAEISDNLPKVWIDPGRITQVLDNLISNSLRYTPKDGRITIRSGIVQNHPGLVEVSVTDTGSGIEPEALPYIFDRFYRADGSRTRSSGGSGLGLAIVKQLVEAQGGGVEAFSPVFQADGDRGYGTKIQITLPSLLRIALQAAYRGLE
jgi:two-component system, OmpR family, sensor histidine kinase BaeS